MVVQFDARGWLDWDALDKRETRMFNELYLKFRFELMMITSKNKIVVPTWCEWIGFNLKVRDDETIR